MAIAVEDTGSGISPEIQARVFEPFFTTKPLGEGTGLGLSSVYGLVKQWDGYIALRSTVGAGTTFTMYLRRQEAPALAHAAAVQRYPRGSETVLVVEDEAAVRSSILRMLSRHGYTVLEARQGGDAIRIFDSSERTISLVITDLMMPEMGGRELIAELGARPTPPRILVMSGYDERASMGGEGLPAHLNFMEKPFSMDGLLQRVRETLDSPRTH